MHSYYLGIGGTVAVYNKQIYIPTSANFDHVILYYTAFAFFFIDNWELIIVVWFLLLTLVTGSVEGFLL